MIPPPGAPAAGILPDPPLEAIPSHENPMNETVARLLEGDTCVLVGSVPGPDGAPRVQRTELTSFVVRATHFWGLSDTVMRPDRPTGSMRPCSFAATDCSNVVPVAIDLPEAAETHQTLRL